MKKRMIYIDSEWDLGQKDYVFETKESALQWLRNNWIDELGSLNSALEEHRITFIPMEIYTNETEKTISVDSDSL